MQLNLIMSSNGLSTIQTYDQTALLLVSTLLGSVFGAMGAISGIMRMFEGNKEIINKQVEKFMNLNNLKNGRKKMQDDLKEDNEADTSKEAPYGAENLELSISI